MITEVRLRNITCFEDVTLDLRSESTDTPAPWVVLLGENGTGKSTILHMMALAIIGDDYLPIISGNVRWSAYIRDKNTAMSPEKAIVDLDVFVTEETKALSIADYVQARLYLEPRIPRFTYGGAVPGRVLPSLSNLFACGYSALRRPYYFSSNNTSAVLPTYGADHPVFRFSTLFGVEGALTDITKWFKDIYLPGTLSSISSDRREYHLIRFELAKRVLCGLLPEVRDVELTEDSEVRFQVGTTTVIENQLSDGYRGMLAWTVDLVRRLFDAFPDSSDPLKERGVVLLDEIDLHLHPRWQRSVVETIRKTFPNLQFIVTTHSPFIVQDMRPEDKIIILERENGEENAPVVARHEPGAVHDWTADQILSSFFGLPQGTRGEEAQKAYRRYERLLDAQAAGTLTAKQRTEMQRLKERLDAAPLGDTSDEQELFAAADTVLDALRRRRKALERARSSGNGRNGSNSNGATDAA
jgi:ABC-type cobalamin/Fe3+-siderophores transport system ATPase subunit